MSEVNQLTEAIIGAAIEVHKRLGPGLLESAYRICLAYELRKRFCFAPVLCDLCASVFQILFCLGNESRRFGK